MGGLGPQPLWEGAACVLGRYGPLEGEVRSGAPGSAVAPPSQKSLTEALYGGEYLQEAAMDRGL